MSGLPAPDENGSVKEEWPDWIPKDYVRMVLDRLEANDDEAADDIQVLRSRMQSGAARPVSKYNAFATLHRIQKDYLPRLYKGGILNTDYLRDNAFAYELLSNAQKYGTESPLVKSASKR